MDSIAVVTDSTAAMPDSLVRQHDIRVVPQVVILDGKPLLDGVDIGADQFYARMKSADELPTTSQATIGAFKQAFEPLVKEGAQIVAVLVGDKLSGTMQSAVQAKAMFPEAKIKIVNSETVAMALGFQVLAAARAVAQGASLEEAAEAAQRAKERTGLIMVLETLEYLHRGGRIGAAARYLGTALNIKPLLEVREGAVEPLERVRTKAKATARLIDIIAERANPRERLQLAVHHAAIPEEAGQFGRELEERLKPSELHMSAIPPAIGAHVGPGALGVAYYMEG